MPAARRAEFDRGYPQVLRADGRCARLPAGGTAARARTRTRYHIFAEWTGAAEFPGWIANPAHARRRPGRSLRSCSGIRRRLFHGVAAPPAWHRPRPHTVKESRRADDNGRTHRRGGAHRADRRHRAGPARRRLPVIEQLATPSAQADKAIGVHCRTMELWEEQGVVREAMDAGIWLTGNMVFVNGLETHRMSWELPDLPYAHLGLPQYETERILTARLATLGVRPRRGAELVDFIQDADGVTAAVRTADGATETVRAEYLVGCDGAHSRVRELLGLTFTGGLGRFPQLFMLVDVDVDWDMPDGHLLRFLHDHRRADGRHAGLRAAARRAPLPHRHPGPAAVLRPDRRAGRAARVQRGTGRADPRRRAGRPRPSRAARHPRVEPALVVGVPDQPRHRRPLPPRPGLRRRRRRPPAPAGRRAGHEHRHPGRLEPGLEAGPGGARAGRAGAAGQLRGRAASGGRGDRRPGGAAGGHRGTGPRRPGTAVPPGDVAAAQLRRQPAGR